MYQTATNLVYITSTNSTGLTWNTPVVVQAVSSFGYTSDYTFNAASNHSVGIALIPDSTLSTAIKRPAIVFALGSATVNNAFYIRSNSVNGATWANASVLVTAIYPYDGTLRMQPRPDFDATAYFNPVLLGRGFPEVLFTDTSRIPKIMYGSGSFNTPSWTVDGTMTVVGQSVDIGLFLNTTVGRWNNPANSNNFQSRTFVFIRSEATTRLFFYRRHQSNLSWLTNFYGFDTMTNYGCIVNIPTLVPATPPFTIARTVALPMTVWQESEIIYTRTMGIDDTFGRVTGQTIVKVASNATRPNLTFGVFNGVAVDYYVGQKTASIIHFVDDQLVFTNEGVNSYSLGIEQIVDTALVNTFTALTDVVGYTSPILFYQIYNNTLVAMIPDDNIAQVGTQYRIVENPPLISGIGGTSKALLSATLTTAQLPSSASSINDAYIGSFLWIYNQNVVTVPSPFWMFNDFRLITAYNGATRTVTVSPAFSADPGSLAIPAGTNTVNWQILQYNGDSFTPLDYIGSRISNQQMSCWMISLSSLTLPNLTLSTSEGNRIAFYPYVYVEFDNITAKNRLILYSNNPHATSALFKVPINSLVSPLQSTFVSLNGSGERQVVKFKPNDSFMFRVLLPNGDLFETVVQDTVSPFPPNPNIQISALFEIIKIVE